MRECPECLTTHTRIWVGEGRGEGGGEGCVIINSPVNYKLTFTPCPEGEMMQLIKILTKILTAFKG